MTKAYVHKPGESRTEIAHISSKVRRREDKQTTATVVTSRADVSSLTEGQDEIEIEEDGTTEFQGSLDSYKYDGTRIRLHVNSFLQYAKEAQPTSPKLSYVDTNDSTIVSDAISNIPDLSAGTIDTVETGVDILLHHASRALQIRLMRKLSKASVRYNSDKTVDYIDPANAGRDRTNITISPANQNLTTAKPKQKGGEQTKTHLRMIGNSGVSADVVASSYSSSDRQRWGRAQYKDIATEAVLVRYGEKLLEDLSNTWTEVDATLTEISDVRLMDQFTVNYPEKDISNQTLTVAEVTEIRDSSGLHYEARLSNRTFARNQQIEEQARRTSEASRVGQTTDAINTPMLTFGGDVRIPPNKFLDQEVTVPPNGKMHVWKFVQAPLNRQVSFKIVKNITKFRGEGTLIYEEMESAFETGSPLATIEGGTDGAIVALRLDNQGDREAVVGLTLSYTVETHNA